MKKVRIAIIALGLVLCSSLPTKKVQAQSGNYAVTFYTFTHWICTGGGHVCCPGFDC